MNKDSKSIINSKILNYENIAIKSINTLFIASTLSLCAASLVAANDMNNDFKIDKNGNIFIGNVENDLTDDLENNLNSVIAIAPTNPPISLKYMYYDFDILKKMFPKIDFDNLTPDSKLSTSNLANKTIAIGPSTIVAGSQSIGIGYATVVAGDQSVALGANVYAIGNDSVAIGGDDTNAAEKDIINVQKWVANPNEKDGGHFTSVEKTVGEYFKEKAGRDLKNDKVYPNNHKGQYYPTMSKGPASVALGVKAASGGGLSLAIGTGTFVEDGAHLGIAIGAGANVDKENAVAIGAGSRTTTNAKYLDEVVIPVYTDASHTTIDHNVTFKGFAGGRKGMLPGDQVSFGYYEDENHHLERQLKHVAPGLISKTSTDAVNGSQLYTIAEILQDQSTKALDELNQKSLTFAGNKDSVDRHLGQTLIIKGDLENSKVASANNIRTQVFGNGELKIDLAENPIFNGKVTANGLDANGHNITNIKKGSNDDDAVNVRQLKDAINNVGVKVATSIKTDTPFVYKINKDGKEITLIKEVKKDGQVVWKDATKPGTPELKDINPKNIYISTINPQNGSALPTKISNIADGKAPHDAVNVSQLENSAWHLEVNGANTAAIKEDDHLNIKKGKNINLASSKENIEIINKEGKRIQREKTTITLNVKSDGKLKVDKNGKLDIANNHKADELMEAGAIKDAINSSGFIAKANGDSGKFVNSGSEVNFIDGNNIKISRKDGNFTVATIENPRFKEIKLGDENNNTNIQGNDTSVKFDNVKLTGVSSGLVTKDGEKTKDLNKANPSNVMTAKDLQNLPLYFSDGKNDFNKTLGQKVVFSGDKNIKVVANSNGMKVNLSNQLKDMDTVDFKDSNVKISKNGINAGDEKIRNVKNGDLGISSTDAVNGSQLYKTNKDLKALENKAMNFAGNTGANVSKKLGETMDIKGDLENSKAASANNIRTEILANGTMKIQISDNPDFNGKVSAKGLDAGDRKITNIAEGSDETDAVNVKQLNKLANNIGSTVATTIKSDSPFSYEDKDGHMLTREIGVDGKTIFKYRDGSGEHILASPEGIKITTIDPATGRNVTAAIIGNVAEGRDDTDAVNVKQLKESYWTLKTNGTKLNDVKQNSVIDFKEGNNIIIETTKNSTESNIKISVKDELKDLKSISIKNGPTINENGIDVKNKIISNVKSNLPEVNNKTHIDKPNNINKSNAATAGDIMNSGWNAQVANTNDNGQIDNKNVGFVKNYNNVKFEAGEGLEAQGEQKGDTTVIKFKIKDDISLGGSASFQKALGTEDNGKIVDTLDGKDNKGKAIKVKSGAKIKTVAGENIKITRETKTKNGTEQKLTYSVNPNLKIESVSIKNSKVNISRKGINAGGKRITNVAKAVAPGDAINKNQFDDGIEKVSKENKAGVASAAAMANLGQPLGAGKRAISAGLATHRGESALAVGLSAWTDDGHWLVKGSAAVDTQSQTTVGGSVTYSW